MYVTGTCIFVSSFRMQLPYPTRSAEPDTPSARPRISLSRLQIPVRTGSKITDMSHDMEGGMFVHAAPVEIRKHRGRNTGTTVFLDSFCPTMVPVRVSRVYPECVQAPPGVFLPVPPASFYRTGTVTGTGMRENLLKVSLLRNASIRHLSGRVGCPDALPGGSCPSASCGDG